MHNLTVFDKNCTDCLDCTVSTDVILLDGSNVLHGIILRMIKHPRTRRTNVYCQFFWIVALVA